MMKQKSSNQDFPTAAGARLGEPQASIPASPESFRVNIRLGRMRIWRMVASLMIALVGCLAVSRAHATVYCIDTPSTDVIFACTASSGDCSLRGALSRAGTANVDTDHDIRVPTGTYQAPMGLSIGESDKDSGKRIWVTGGWNAACSARVVDPANTIINAENGTNDGNLYFFGRRREMLFEGLTFLNFSTFNFGNTTCTEFAACPEVELMSLRFNAWRHGQRVLAYTETAKRLTIENNLFADLSEPNFSPVRLRYGNNEFMPTIAFNTFANLNCMSASQTAVQVYSKAGDLTLHHNIFQSSGCASDVSFDPDSPSSPYYLRNNLFLVQGGQTPAGISGNVISANPGFVNAASGNYKLRVTAPISPAVNAGMDTLEAAQFGLSLPNQDLDGPVAARVVGTRVDMGAFESALSNESAYTVTSAADAGTGSLRAAIVAANALPGRNKIIFNIVGTCPRLIILQSALPDITDSVEIDGYAQPGAAANLLTNGSNAQLCIALTASSGTFAQFLQVPELAPASTSVILKGIAFTGATGFNGNATIMLGLRGGRDHVIQGNAFGGIGPGTIGSLGAPMFGIQIRGTAQNALIGGPQPEHRNSFGAMSGVAIVLSDASSGFQNPHTIQNNYFGLSADGNSASPFSGSAIVATDTREVTILENTLVATPNAAAIKISGASATGYRIRSNRIGVSPFGVSGTNMRVDTGIQIGNGSGMHDIGFAGGYTLSNTITNSNAAGIHITPTAGTGTLVLHNRIFGNGIAGSGLGIDLGVLGILPNDLGDTDGGPNGGQNWPVVVSSTANPDGTRQLHLTVSSSPQSTFSIEVYRSPTCPDGDRGADMLTRVAYAGVTTDASGSAVLDIPITGAGAPGYLSATASSLSNGDSSEPGPCFLEPDAISNDMIFADGFETPLN